MLQLKGTVKGLLFIFVPLVVMKSIGFPPLIMGIVFILIAAVSFMLGYFLFKDEWQSKLPDAAKHKAFHLTLSPLAFLLAIVAFFMAFAK